MTRSGMVREFDYGLQEFIEPVLPGCDGRHHGYAESLLHGLCVYRIPFLLCLVIDVQGHDNRYLQLQKLDGEVEVSFEVRGVNDIDDRVRHLMNEIITC